MNNMIGKLICTFLLLFLMCACADAQESKLHALVIGNSEYGSASLKNPKNDADLMASSLKELGFRVSLATDLDQPKMEKTIKDFSAGLPKGSLAFFYFAGHGIRAKEVNYLIPSNTQIGDEVALKYKAIRTSFVLDYLSESKSSLNVMVFDCCQNNPFDRGWNRSLSNRGLAAEVVPEGTIVTFSTSPGKTATDGKPGKNSPYTMELSKQLLTTPPNGLRLRDAFFNASQAIKKSTGQAPWLQMDAGAEEFFLKKPIQMTGVEKNAVRAGVVNSMAKKGVNEIPLPVEAATKKIELLTQGEIFLKEQRFQLAIDSFSGVIDSESFTNEQKAAARRARIEACLGRLTEPDILQAILDAKSLGKQAVNLSLQTDGEVRSGSNLVCRLPKGKVVRVSKYQDGWLRVDSPLGDSSSNGWVKLDSFTKTASQDTGRKTDGLSNVSGQQTLKNSSISGGYKASGVGANGSALNSRQSNQVVGSNGMVTNGAYGNGTMVNGSYGNGAVVNGSYSNGVVTNGAYGNGTMVNGSYSNGVVTNGAYGNGTMVNGSYGNGAVVNGSYSNGVVPNGSYGNSGFGNNGYSNGSYGNSNSVIQQGGAQGGKVNIWQTPQWESLREIRELRKQGRLK